MNALKDPNTKTSALSNLKWLTLDAVAWILSARRPRRGVRRKWNRYN